MFNLKNFLNAYSRSAGFLSVWITATYIILNQFFDGVDARLYLDMQIALLLASIPNTVITLAVKNLSKWKKRIIIMLSAIHFDIFFILTIALNPQYINFPVYIGLVIIGLTAALVYCVIYDAVQKNNIKKINKKLNEFEDK